MKTAASLLLIILTQISIILNGQTYKPVITNDSVSWDVAGWELFEKYMFKLHCQKHPDSLYTSLYSNIWYSLEPEEYMGKIREDINTGRIYYLDPWFPDEKLIMDMTLKVGDTFQLNSQQLIVVDSVYYHDDRKVIRFDYYTYWDEKIMFIEGVGPSISVIYRYNGYYPFYATCKYQNDELVYVNNNTTHFIGCVLDPTGTAALDTTSDFILYPNPVRDMLYIQINPALQSSSELKIFDSYGRLIRHTKLSGYSHALELRNLNKGLYYVNILNGHSVFIDKLVIIK